jgi:hypothetical protein
MSVTCGFWHTLDSLEPERVLVDHAVHTAVAGPAYPGCPLLSAAVSHRYPHVEHRMFQKVRVLIAQPFEQLRRNISMQARHTGT